MKILYYCFGLVLGVGLGGDGDGGGMLPESWLTWEAEVHGLRGPPTEPSSGQFK